MATYNADVSKVRVGVGIDPVYPVEGGGSGTAQIPFSTTIPFTGNAVMAQKTITGATDFTPNLVGAVPGVEVALMIISGTVMPTFTGFSELASSFGYDNSAPGIPNPVYFNFDGVGPCFAVIPRVVNPPIVTPVAPSWSAAPVVTSATQGSPVTFTSGTASGTPTPTITFRTTLDGSPVGTANTAYTPLVGDVGKSIRIIQTATNSAGTVDSSASAPFTVVASGGLQAEVTAWLARISALGGSVSTTERDAADALVVSAKTNGYFSSFRRLGLGVGDAIAMTAPLINTSGAAVDTFVGGLTTAPATGWTSDGTGYINTGYTPTEATGGLSVYLRTTQASDTTARFPMGCRNAGVTQVFRIAGNTAGDGAATAGAVCGSWGGIVGASNVQAATTGGLVAAMWHESRESSTVSKLYKNGTLVGSMATATTPASATVPLFVGCNNSGGTAAAFLAAGSSIGAYAVDSGMTPTQAAAYRTDMQAFQAALGRSV